MPVCLVIDHVTREEGGDTLRRVERFACTVSNAVRECSTLFPSIFCWSFFIGFVAGHWVRIF